MTTEPKRYTAKEAMHWMIDHPGLPMRQIVDEQWFYKFDIGNGRFEFSFKFGGGWTGANMRTCDTEFYIRAEYDAWQAALAAEVDDKAPRVGESLHEFILRGIDGALVPTSEMTTRLCDRWIDANFQRKEGR